MQNKHNAVMQNKHNAVLEINNKEMPYPKEDRTPARNNPMMMNKIISITRQSSRKLLHLLQIINQYLP
jgi:hypothetical protein